MTTPTASMGTTANSKIEVTPASHKNREAFWAEDPFPLEAAKVAKTFREFKSDEKPKEWTAKIENSTLNEE